MKTKPILFLLVIWQTSLAMLPAAQPLSVANNAFGFNLLRQIAQEQPASNIFISPYSAATVLQIAASGAAGSTKSEMQQVLKTSGLSTADVGAASETIAKSLNTGNTNVILTTANAIWYRQQTDVKADFLADNRKYFNATIAPLDFLAPHSADIVNQWANDQTHGRINEIVSGRFDPSTELFLANAVYFKGKWADPFKEQATHDRPFHLRGGGQKNVPLMNQTKTFTYRRGTGYQAVRLPYEDENLAMYIFLPDTNSSPEKLLSILNGDSWQRITKPGFSEKAGTLALPRFKLDYSVLLNAPLKAMGMKTAFDSNAADFSGIAPQLYISSVLQKTFVEVKEEGTEAAAVTGITVEAAGIEMPPPNPFQMIVDRPFLFLIEDNETGMILFMGVVYDPASN